MLFCLQHPVLGLQALDATEMLGVVSHYGNVVNANDVVIARQQSRLCQFLLTVVNGGIVGSV